MATTQPPPTTRGQVPCSYHPNVLTGLRCSRCGKPICPRCGVRTPVGLRCPDCAGVRGLPTYRTGGSALAKAAGIGLAVAIPVGVLFGFAPTWQFYLCLLLGFGVAEGIAWATNAKRGPDLQLLAMGLIALGLVLGRVILAQRLGVTLADVNDLSTGVFTPGIVREFGRPVSVGDALRLNLIPDLVYAALALAIGWIRFR
jgi:hypothetical protein